MMEKQALIVALGQHELFIKDEVPESAAEARAECLSVGLAVLVFWNLAGVYVVEAAETAIDRVKNPKRRLQRLLRSSFSHFAFECSKRGAAGGLLRAHGKNLIAKPGCVSGRRH